MNEDKLKFYYEDIDSIFEMVKEELGYDDFTLSLKKLTEPPISIFQDLAKREIEQYIWETENAVMLLEQIRMTFQDMMVHFRIANENYKTKIYNMSKGFKTDSQLPYNFNSKDWQFVIKIKE